MDPDLLSVACHLYNTLPDRITPLSGGHYNAVYQFPLPATTEVSRTLHSAETCEGMQSGILRIGLEDCPPDQTLAMLDWVDYLAREGAPVSAPVPSIHGNLMEMLEFGGQRYTVTAFEKATGSLAEMLPCSTWTSDLFRSIGVAVGKFHRLSCAYKSSNQNLSRPPWYESYEVISAQKRLQASQDPARSKLTDLIRRLHSLPVSHGNYGMIHGDLHFANFLVQSNGLVTIIDFDDCGYGWFAMDISMALFDVLVLCDATNEEERRAFARQFLTHYLSGYRQEFKLSTFWQAQIPLFIKLKELCIYADLIGHPDIDHANTWVGKFMRDRSARIFLDKPYVDIDFQNL